MVNNIRKTSNVVSLGKAGSSKSTSSADQNTAAHSPFAANPTQSLKHLTDRKSKPRTEEQRLALLQNALKSFATEARSHLPVNLGKMEQKVRKKMIDEGFSEVVANEAGDEAVDVLLENRRVTPNKKSQG
ncbi:MAG: hypothetical protein Q7T03_02545 [Deltaproteobacteria bacterium]|nr:hypothetical protein [Deltaproteobacteria bacterium]